MTPGSALTTGSTMKDTSALKGGRIPNHENFHKDRTHVGGEPHDDGRGDVESR